MRKLTCTLTRYRCLLTATRTHWFNHAFQIKHHHGLNSSSVTTTLAASRPDSSYTDFHPYWWAKRPIETPPCVRVRTVRFENLDRHSSSNDGRPSDLK
jgi:hypothetical protein